jgi:autophagy-related protein 9
MIVHGSSQMDWQKLPDKYICPTGDVQRLYTRFGNLDTFLRCAYCYYTRRGFWCVCSESLTYVLTVGFTTLYAHLLLLFVDWGQVLHCHDTDGTSECVIFRFTGDEFTTTGWISTWLFLTMCTIFWIWNVAYCVYSIRRYGAIRRIFHIVNRRDISRSCEWSDVCEILASIAETLRVPGLVRRLTVTDINQRITRHDSFMSAFINKSLFDCRETPIRFSQSCLTRTLEWSIARCIFSEMLNPDGTLNLVFIHAPRRLRRQFRVLGCIMGVVSPFLFIFIAIYYFFKYAEHVYKNPVYMASRRWSPYARLRLRTNIELPHLLSNRVALAYKHVDLFVGKHPPHLPCIWGRFVSFILGSVVGTILVMGVLSERALLFRVGEHDLLWILALLSSMILLVRSTTEIQRVSQEAVDVNVSTLKSNMRNIPDEWHSCSSEKVATDLRMLCPSVVVFFVCELLGILTTPLHLFFSISYRAYDIVTFIETQSTTQVNVGVVCQAHDEKEWEVA